MTASPRPAHGGAERRGRWLPAILALAVLLPAAVLFGQFWRWTGTGVADAATERDGIAYLVALSQLTTALGDAGSSAAGGRSAAKEPVSRAVDAVSQVDRRVGGDLRTTERWTALRTTVEALPGGATEATLSAYTEATDSVLALYRIVRVNAYLVREPATDAFYLADAAAEEVPETLVAAGRLSDLAVLAGTRPTAEQQLYLAGLATARATMVQSARSLADDLQSAVDSTQQSTLSAALLSRLDRFRRTVDALSAATTPADPRRPTAIDAAAAERARVEVQATGAELAAAILREVDTLVAGRQDDLARQRQIALACIVLAVILAVAPTVAVLMYRRRRRHERGRDDQPSGPLGRVSVEPAPMEPLAGEQIGELAAMARRERERSGAR